MARDEPDDRIAIRSDQYNARLERLLRIDFTHHVAGNAPAPVFVVTPFSRTQRRHRANIGDRGNSDFD
jgi:hypothetical protein